MSVQVQDRPVVVKVASDGLLARRAAAGDEAAFRELARRYRELVSYVGRWEGGGVTVEDLRQEALIALYDACRAHNPAHCAFGAYARVCVRNRIKRARRDATRRKHELLSQALGLDCPRDDGLALADVVPCRRDENPARVVELRERLADVAANHQRRRQADRQDNGRYYTDEQIAQARAMVRGGKSLAIAGQAVGAPRATVWRWVKQAA